MDFRTIVSFFRYIHVLGVFTDVSDPFHVLFSITHAKWRRVIKNYSLHSTIIVIIPSPKKIPVCAIVNPSRMHPPGRQLGGSSGNLFIATLIIHHPYLFTISALPSLSPLRLSPEKSEIITKTEFNATGGGGRGDGNKIFIISGPDPTATSLSSATFRGARTAGIFSPFFYFVLNRPWTCVMYGRPS